MKDKQKRTIKITELINSKFKEEFYLEREEDLNEFDKFMSKLVLSKIMKGDVL